MALAEWKLPNVIFRGITALNFTCQLHSSLSNSLLVVGFFLRSNFTHFLKEETEKQGLACFRLGSLWCYTGGVGNWALPVTTPQTPAVVSGFTWGTPGALHGAEEPSYSRIRISICGYCPAISIGGEHTISQICQLSVIYSRGLGREGLWWLYWATFYPTT